MTLSYQNVNANISFSQKIADIKLQIEKIDRQIEQIKLQSSLLPLNQILLGDCYDVLKTFPDNSIDCVVTDPPYSLGRVKDVAKLINAWMSGEDGIEHHSNGFMGKDWDVIPSPKTWKEVYRVLKPGGYALVFAGTRTMDLMGLSLRLAGFEVQDSIAWMQGQGFPKGRQQLKPSHEPILVCYKPGKRSLNIDECRIGVDSNDKNLRFNEVNHKGDSTLYQGGLKNPITYPHSAPSSGRYPSNVLLSHHADCIPCGTKRVKTLSGSNILKENHKGDLYKSGFKPMTHLAHHSPDGTETIAAYQCHPECPIAILDAQTAGKCNGSWGKSIRGTRKNAMIGCRNDNSVGKDIGFYDEGELGSASRFFLNLPPETPFVYSPKASKSDRTCGEKVENTHVTVKPTQLIQYLVKLVCPENGVVLDPFIGSGTTALACIKENRYYIGIEREREYFDIALERIKHCS